MTVIQFPGTRFVAPKDEPMSFTIFPAAPGTVILTLKRGETTATITPVVGYQHIQSSLVFPLCPIQYGGLTRGVVLRTPDGLITDPSYGLVFADTEEWMNVAKTDAYWEAKDRLAVYKTLASASKEAVDDDDDPIGIMPSEQPKAKPGRRSAVEKGEAPVSPKDMPQVFATKSFWKTTDKPDDPKAKWAIFECEPGVEAPAKSNKLYVKIKREEWFELRRQKAEIIEWPMKFGQTAKPKPKLDDVI